MAYQRWFKTVRDQQGNAVNGASCTVYEVGTSTIATVYDPNSDDASPSPQANPFTTTSNGRFGFMAADGEYDVVIQGGSLATQQYRVTLNGGSLGSISVLDFGADATGIDDSTAAFQAAMDAGGDVTVPVGTYRITGTVECTTPNTRLVLDAGAVVDCVGMPNLTPAIRFTGSKTLVGDLTAAGVKSGTTVALTVGNASGLTALNYIKIDSDEQFNATRPEYLKGEICQVASVDYGTGVVTLKNPLFDSYSITGKTPYVSKLSLLDGVGVSGGKFLFDQTKNQDGIEFAYCSGPRITTDIFGPMNFGINFDQCVDFCASECVVGGVANIATPTGYAILSSGSQYGEVSNNKFYDNRHCYTDVEHGVTRCVLINENICRGSVGSAISPHGNSEFITISGNIVIGGTSDGITSRGHNHTIEDNQIYACDRYGISTAEEGGLGLVVRGNRLHSTGSVGSKTAILMDNDGPASNDIVVEDNLAVNWPNGGGISIQNALRGSVSNNTMYGVGYDGISLADCSNLSVRGNTIKKTARASKYGIKFTISTGACDANVVDANYVDETFAGAVWIPSGATKFRKGAVFAPNIPHVVYDTAAPEATAAALVGPGGFVTTPALPAGTGSGNAVYNTTSVTVLIYLNGGAGTTVVDKGTTNALVGTQTTVLLNPGARVYFTGSVPASWLWYGINN